MTTPQPDNFIDEVLRELVTYSCDFCRDNAPSDHVHKVNPAEKAKAALLRGIETMVLEVIGKDDIPTHATGEYDEYKMCNTCDRVLGDDSDYDSKCLCEYNNYLRAEQRQRLTEVLKGGNK